MCSTHWKLRVSTIKFSLSSSWEDRDSDFWSCSGELMGQCVCVCVLHSHLHPLTHIHMYTHDTHYTLTHSQMDCRVAILPEVILPPLPLYLSPCPPCVHSGALASRIVARSAGNKTSPFNQQQNTTYHKLLQVHTHTQFLCDVCFDVCI